ncbi:MAG: PAS domain S-box protein [Thermoanaerobaculia bacterium]
MHPHPPSTPLEQQLREAEERYRLTFQNAHVGMAIAGPNRRFLSVNRRFSEIVGYSEEEMLTRTFADIGHPEDNTIAIAAHERLARRDTDFAEYERRYIRKDGSIVWAHVSLSAAREADGELAYVIGVIEDITDLRASRRKHSELARLGSIALGNATLSFLFTSSAEVIRDTLQAEAAEVVKWLDDRSLVVGGAGSAPDKMAARTTFTDGVFVVGKHGDELQPIEAGAEPGSVVMINVRIDAGHRQAWGELVARWGRPKRIASSDVDFVRAVANLLGQAIERRRTEVELRIRATQQSAIAEIRRLTSDDVDQGALDRVCGVVMGGLGVDRAAILKPDAGGWNRWAGTSVLGSVPGAATDARLVMESGTAAKIENRDGFWGIIAPLNHLGVLSCYSSAQKRFDTGDVQFVEAVAVVIVNAIEREAARGMIIDSERRFRAVIEGASEIIFSVSPEGVILALNPAWETVTGYRPADWLGKRFDDLIPDEEKPAVYALFQSITESPRAIRVQVRIQGRNEKVLLDVAASARVADGRVVEIYGFARDATEEHRLTTKLEQAGRLASLGRLAATVAHEFNNVLMGISPFMELIRKDNLSERASAAVDQAMRAVSRGKRITEDILRFAQPAEPAMVSLNAATWIEALAGEAQSVIGPKYTVVVEAHAPLRIAGDQHQLHQAFINLILNARDAMPHGGIITLRALREAPGAKFPFGDVRSPESFAHLVVEDRGSGIPAETLDHIFEPLFTTKKSGTGLGLPVARQVIARHGGEIFVESVVGKGTRFHLFIPLASGPQLAGSIAASAEATRCRSVLLVEDEQSVAAGIGALLEAEGIAVRVVGSGSAVLPALAHSRPDAVILDIGLPDIEGTRVFESLEKVYPDLPVVFSSGHGDASKLERYLAKPHVAFLLKPYEVDTLLATLNRVVTVRR